MPPETHCCWVSSSLITTAFSHLAALTDCVENLNHLLLQSTSYSFALSLNLLSPLTATYRIRSVLICGPILKLLRCLNMIKEEICRCYIFKFFLLKDAHAGVPVVIHKITPHQSSLLQSVCLCLSVFSVVSPSPSYIHGIVHTYTPPQPFKYTSLSTTHTN